MIKTDWARWSTKLCSLLALHFNSKWSSLFTHNMNLRIREKNELDSSEGSQLRTKQLGLFFAVGLSILFYLLFWEIAMNLSFGHSLYLIPVLVSTADSLISLLNCTARFVLSSDSSSASKCSKSTQQH